MSKDQYGNKAPSFQEVLDAMAHKPMMPDANRSDYLKEQKAQKAFEKLDELGYRYDSGLYGWLPKRGIDNG